MTSRCFIAYLNDSREYDSIFCADGHPEYVGNTLVRHYSSEEHATSLITEGDISFLGNNLKESKFYDEDFGFNRSFSTMDAMVEFYRQCGCNYGYVYAQDEWFALYITPDGTSPVNLNLLTNA